MRRKSDGHKRSRSARGGASMILSGLVIVLAPLASARAQDGGGHPVDSTMEMLNLKASQGSVPAFVETSRPKTSRDFMPVGTQHPTRSIKIKSPADLQAATAALDAARIHQDAISGRKQPTEAPPAGAKAVKPKVAKTKAPGAAATKN